MERQVIANLENWKAKADRKPLILKGARQVGKTHTLKEFGSNNFNSMHYFDFERDRSLATVFDSSLEPQRIIRDLSILKDININTKTDLLVFDEIQECPKALTALKYFYQDLPELAVCSAGSLLGVSLGYSSFPVGKVDFLDLYPMNFEEFLIACGKEQIVGLLTNIKLDTLTSIAIHEKIWHLLKCYFVVGGLPEVVKNFTAEKQDLNSALHLARNTQKALITSYLADMAKHSGKQNSMHLERLWRNIPSQLGRDQDTGATKFIFKDVIPGNSGYSKLAGVIDWLEKAGLVYRCPIVNRAALPFSAYTKENTFKLFLFDVGLLGAIGELSPQSILSYDYGSFKGFFAENFVIQEFISVGRSNQYCWKEKESEVEFLCEHQGEIIPIEVKSGLSSKTRSLKVYLEKYNPKHAIIFSRRDNLDTRKNNTYPSLATNIYHCPLYASGQINSLIAQL